MCAAETTLCGYVGVGYCIIIHCWMLLFDISLTRRAYNMLGVLGLLGDWFGPEADALGLHFGTVS